MQTSIVDSSLGAAAARSGSKRKLQENSQTAEGKRVKLTPPVETGYFPATLHTFIAGYFVLRKAGQGAYGSVWICWDTVEKRFVAVKISRSETMYREAAEDEVDVFRFLSERRVNQEHIIEFYSSFDLEHNGRTHICLVFEAMGEDLSQRLRSTGSFSVADVQNSTKAVLTALVALHRVGVVHTDIKPCNVLVGMSRKAELQLVLETRNALKSTAKYRGHLRDLINYVSGLKSRRETIKVADLGSAQFLNAPHFEWTITTEPYRSYEALMCEEWNEKTDIWSVGCMAYQLATSAYLLQPCNDNQNKLLQGMISRLGMPPRHLRDQSSRFDKPAVFKMITPCEIKARNPRNFHTKAAQVFVEFLRQTLIYDPEKRPSALICFDHPFLREKL